MGFELSITIAGIDCVSPFQGRLYRGTMPMAWLGATVLPCPRESWDASSDLKNAAWSTRAKCYRSLTPSVTVVIYSTSGKRSSTANFLGSEGEEKLNAKPKIALHAYQAEDIRPRRLQARIGRRRSESSTQPEQ